MKLTLIISQSFLLVELLMTITKLFFLLKHNIIFQIYILNADEIAGIDTEPQHVWDFRIEDILFSVKQTYTTLDTKQLSIKQRHCAFPGEIKLQVR